MEEKKTKLSFKVISIALAVLLLISVIPISSMAAGGKITVTDSFVTYKHSVKKPGTDHIFIWDWAYMPMYEINGQEAYCIDPYRSAGSTAEPNYPNSVWWSFSREKREQIALALIYGKPGNFEAINKLIENDPNAETFEKRKQFAYLATKLIIWQYCLDLRDLNTAEVSDSQFSQELLWAFFGRNFEYTVSMQKVYNYIDNLLTTHKTIPSFASKYSSNSPTIKLEWKGDHYEATLKDTNGVLDRFDFSGNHDGVNITQVGNTLTLYTNPGETLKSSEIVISATKEMPVDDTDAQLITWGGDGQDMVTGVNGYADPVPAYFKVAVDTVSLGVEKSSVDYNGVEVQKPDSRYSGLYFKITGTDGTEEILGPTDVNGQIRSGTGVKTIQCQIGETYTIEELGLKNGDSYYLPDNYTKPEPITYTPTSADAGKVIIKSFTNSGETDLNWKIQKTVVDESGNVYTGKDKLADWYFKITGGNLPPEGLTVGPTDSYGYVDVDFDFRYDTTYTVEELGKMVNDEIVFPDDYIKPENQTASFTKTSQDSYTLQMKFENKYAPNDLIIKKSVVNAEGTQLTKPSSEYSGWYFKVTGGNLPSEGLIVGPTNSSGELSGTVSQLAGTSLKKGTYTVEELGLKNSDGDYYFPDIYSKPENIQTELNNSVETVTVTNTQMKFEYQIQKTITDKDGETISAPSKLHSGLYFKVTAPDGTSTVIGATDEYGKTPAYTVTKTGTYTVEELGTKNSDGSYTLGDEFLKPEKISFEIIASDAGKVKTVEFDNDYAEYSYSIKKSIKQSDGSMMTAPNDKLAGWYFEVTSPTGDKTTVGPTDNYGNTNTIEATTGTWTIKELGVVGAEGGYVIPDEYMIPATKTVNITRENANQTTVFEFVNTMDLHSMVVQKLSEDNKIEGITFYAYMPDGNGGIIKNPVTGQPYEMYTTTDENGLAVFNEVPSGVWIVQEENVPEWYIKPEPQTIIVKGSGAKDFTYSLNADGGMTITGYKGTGGQVDIPSTIDGYPVTEIADYVFNANPHVMSVTIPGTVTKIGQAAFMYASLKTVVLPANLEEIPFSCFAKCPNLRNVYVYGKDTKIDNYAFQGSGFIGINATMYGYTGSPAETYANNNGIKFVSIGTYAANEILDEEETTEAVTEPTETTEEITEETEATKPAETIEATDEVTETTKPTTETVEEPPAEETTESPTETADVPTTEEEAGTLNKKKDDIYYKDESLDVSLPPENEKLSN